MRIILIILFTVFLLLPTIFASCDSNQIDINEASAEELDELYGIGPAKAEAIINARPFETIDDLINVLGIGEITLNKIKEQDLACVEASEKEEEKEHEVDLQEKENIFNEEIEDKVEEKQVKEIQTIVLSPKDIKSENNTEQLDKNTLAIYGLVIFCVLLVFLFRFRKTRKNEFK